MERDDRGATALAGLCAAFMIGQQVAGKATRDALFLTSFSVEDLPWMIGVSAAVSLAAVVAVSRLLSGRGPARVVPSAFLLSGVALLALSALTTGMPRAAAILLYLHVAGFGAVLISGFWSVVNERFDPRSVRRNVGRIAAGGAFGGLVGGLGADRLAGQVPVPGILLLLAGLHLACALCVRGVGAAPSRSVAPSPPRPPREILLGILRRPYLRDVSFLVLIGATAAVLLDYLFKAGVVGSLGNGEEMLSFFARFYTAVGVLTFLLQWGLAQRVLVRMGLANTLATHSAGIAVGASAIMVAPGLASVVGARAAESALRGSFFRSGYEPLYVPLPEREKRESKQFIDVGFERLGDALGAGLVAIVLSMPVLDPRWVLAVGAMLMGLGGVWITRRVHRGWIRALEHRLEDHADEIDLGDHDKGSRTLIMQTIAALDLGRSGTRRVSSRPVESPPPPVSGDPVTDGAQVLRRRDEGEVRQLLLDTPRIPPEWVPHVIPMLAWDEMAPIAASSLKAVAGRHSGQALDALLDPETDFAIRRRLPAVLVDVPSARVGQGLLLALRDRRFEVRYRVGLTLLALKRRHPDCPIDSEAVLDAVLREVRVERRVWESHRLLDQADSHGEGLLDMEILRRRSNLSLEHVFTLLAVVLPDKPLSVAYAGLLTEDRVLRGTALEYLESVLPPRIRQELWPHLEPEGTGSSARPDAEEVLARLLESHTSIQLHLRSLERE